MIELLEQANYWHWLAFGLGLLLLELLGTAGYLLWLGISAMLVGLIISLMPLSWQMQWTSFASFSLITTWLWWRYQYSKDKSEDKSRVLNQRDRQMIGQTTRLEETIERGNCRIQLGDSCWSARTDTKIDAGTLVEVVDVEGIILIIKPVA